MSASVETDVKALKADIAQMREDFAQLMDTLKTMTRHTGERVRDIGCGSGDGLAEEIKTRVSAVAKEIEDKPVTSALAAFAGGMLLGALFKSSR